MDIENQLLELQNKNENLLQEIAQLKMDKEAQQDEIEILTSYLKEYDDEYFRKKEFKNILKDIYK